MDAFAWCSSTDENGSWLFVAAVGIFVCRLLIKYTVAAHEFAALPTRAVFTSTMTRVHQHYPIHSFNLKFRLHLPASQHSCQQIYY